VGKGSEQERAIKGKKELQTELLGKRKIRKGNRGRKCINKTS
jgi:hypothetical protein